MIGLGSWPWSRSRVLAQGVVTSALEQTLKADLTLTTTSFTPFSPEVADLVRAGAGAGSVSEFLAETGFRIDGSDELP